MFKGGLLGLVSHQLKFILVKLKYHNLLVFHSVYLMFEGIFMN